MGIVDSFPRGGGRSASLVFPRSLLTKQASFSARMVVDVFCGVEMILIVVASVIAKHFYIVRILEDNDKTEPYLFAGITCALLFQFALSARRLNEAAAPKHFFTEWKAVLGSLALAFLALTATAYVFKVSANFSRGWLISWFALSCAMLLIARFARRRLLLWVAEAGGFDRRIAVVCLCEQPSRLLDAIGSEQRARVIGVFKIDPDKIIEHALNPTSTKSVLSALIEAGKQHNIDELIVRVPRLEREKLDVLINELSIIPADIWLSIDSDEIDYPISAFGRVGSFNLLQVRRKPIEGWGRVAKEAMDYVLAAIGILSLAPVFGLIAAAIKLDSSGPVFFRQRRHGCNEEEIVVWKFRTMTVAEDGDNVQQAKQSDPRVTRVGRILRKTSLDELPQLINVLRGEMSLVGPRPHALVHNEHYRTLVRSYANRHKVKPGITGMAQIHGLRGETDTPDKMQRRVEMDLQYIDNWSIGLDIKILLLTPIYAFMSRNAY